ncbi:hypothetical protein CH289_27240 [Rhodococcus sp. RS1C4]|nr:2Fe-2S iron-sulfur cluster-binding protein [Rhodococcus sp. RS1C4]OZC42689.1 hypothetical protein CH289_27240 [Rhodococcus sp. RS1C4]
MPENIDRTHEVQVLPSGLQLEVHPGESLMAAADRLGYSWPNICGGHAICGVCNVRVIHGSDNADQLTTDERTRLRLLGRAGDTAIRLACQLTVTGPLTVYKRGIRPPSTDPAADDP